MSSLSGSWSWCVATPLLEQRQWSNGFGKEAGETQGTALSPCPAAQPGQQLWEESEPISLLSFVLPQACVPAAVAIWVALGSLGCGGRGGLSPWARTSPRGWQMSGVSYSSLLSRQEAWGSRLWKPKQNTNGSQLFSDLFVPTDGDVYRQPEQSCRFLRGYPGKRDMCATIYHKPFTLGTHGMSSEGLCLAPLATGLKPICSLCNHLCAASKSLTLSLTHCSAWK